MSLRFGTLLTAAVVLSPSIGLSFQAPDFSISASPGTQTVWQASSTSYLVTITPANSFTGAVTFAASGLPFGASAAFSPSSVTGSGTTTMTLSTAPGTPVGTSTVTITGTSGYVARVLPLALHPARRRTTSVLAFPQGNGVWVRHLDGCEASLVEIELRSIGGGMRSHAVGFCTEASTTLVRVAPRLDKRIARFFRTNSGRRDLTVHLEQSSIPYVRRTSRITGKIDDSRSKGRFRKHTVHWTVRRTNGKEEQGVSKVRLQKAERRTAPTRTSATSRASASAGSGSGCSSRASHNRGGFSKNPRFTDRFLNRTDGIMGSMLFPVALAAFLILGVAYKGVDADDALKPFVWLENFVLAFMAGISTYNYQATAAKLKELPVLPVIFRLNVLMWFNVAWFTATVYFTQPTPRLSFIVAIYATFTIANLIQVTKSSAVQSCKARSNAILEASAFLREENGPTMIAYTIMVLAIVAHSKYRAEQHQYLEAFAGGVAAFHLAFRSSDIFERSARMIRSVAC